MARSIRSLAVAAVLAVGALGSLVAPTRAQTMMMDACMVPTVPSYPGAEPASAPMLAMRGGMAHAVSVWATGDSVQQVIGYYRAQLAAEGYEDSSASISQTMAGPAQTAGAGAELINSAEFSKDGRQFVYIAGTSPGFMLAVGCR
ncbi:MAG TPA: hypothetical protein VFE37_05780 [Chloroflexota bacterium]|nr:hypothetical protein [Chloroflexota bacterium]